MKKSLIIFLTVIILPLFGFAQSIENLDFISPFHNDVAAIKNDGKWGFINKEGQQIVGFRTDLVETKTDQGKYPMFTDERCQIIQIKAGISYYGFIDKSGKIIIEPQFLDATNFINGVAIALKLDKQILSRNSALDKEMVNYRYFEVLINTDGKILYYLNQDGVNIVLDKDFMEATPKITSKYLSEDLYAVKGKNESWTVIKVKDKL